jgi:uncharacterized delta-60 repeat protein
MHFRLLASLLLAINVLVLSDARAEDPIRPRFSSPSLGVVAIAVAPKTSLGAIAARTNGTLLVAVTTKVAQRRDNLSMLNLTADGLLVDNTTRPIADVELNSVGEVTITADGAIFVIGDAYAPGVVNSQYGARTLEFLVARFLPSGKPDTNFGHDGWTLTDVGQLKNHNIPHGVAIQGDGRIVVAGNSLVPYWLIMTAYSFSTVRYDANGSVDASFGRDGRVITRMGSSREDAAQAVLATSDGKIVVVGTADTTKNVHCDGNFLDCLQAARSDFALARYLPSGQLDTSFGNGGRTGPIGVGWTSAASSAASDMDGRIVVGGSVTLSQDRATNRSTQAPAIARYGLDGKLDHSFGKGGVVLLESGGTAITAIAAMPDGKIVVGGLLHVAKCGTCLAVMRLNADGMPDVGFGRDGICVLPFHQGTLGGHGIVLQANGKLVLAGELSRYRGAGSDIMLARINADGTLDPTFGAGPR